MTTHLTGSLPQNRFVKSGCGAGRKGRCTGIHRGLISGAAADESAARRCGRRHWLLRARSGDLRPRRLAPAIRPNAGAPLDLLLKTKAVIYSLNDSREKVPSPSTILGDVRWHIVVPMLKENGLVGAIVIYRQEVRRFSAKQIELVTFTCCRSIQNSSIFSRPGSASAFPHKTCLSSLACRAKVN